MWLNHLDWPVMEGRTLHCQAPKYSLLKFYLSHLARISSLCLWSSAQALGMAYLGTLSLLLSRINCRLQPPVYDQAGCVLLCFSFMELYK